MHIFALPEAEVIQSTDICDPGIFDVFKFNMGGRARSLVLVLVGCCLLCFVFWCLCLVFGVWCLVFSV